MTTWHTPNWKRIRVPPRLSRTGSGVTKKTRPKSTVAPDGSAGGTNGRFIISRGKSYDSFVTGAPGSQAEAAGRRQRRRWRPGRDEDGRAFSQGGRTEPLGKEGLGELPPPPPASTRLKWRNRVLKVFHDPPVKEPRLQLSRRRAPFFLAVSRSRPIFMILCFFLCPTGHRCVRPFDARTIGSRIKYQAGLYRRVRFV